MWLKYLYELKYSRNEEIRLNIQLEDIINYR